MGEETVPGLGWLVLLRCPSLLFDGLFLVVLVLGYSWASFASFLWRCWVGVKRRDESSWESLCESEAEDDDQSEESDGWGDGGRDGGLEGWRGRKQKEAVHKEKSKEREDRKEE